ncbi:MAG: hypothetical protein ACP5VE_03700 [Chthonomonadales bacterium]
MHYLAIHDFLWINTVVTGVRMPYDPAALEKAMAAQYAYGRSDNALRQAAHLLGTMLRNPPFTSGNLATAFLAVATFLLANGYRLGVPGTEAAQLVVQCLRREITSDEAVKKMAVPSGGEMKPGDTLRTLVARLCHEHAEGLALLAEQEVRAAA